MMNTKTFAGLLAAVPPADLRLLELTAELTRDDGAQARDYAAATHRLIEALRWQLQPRRA